MNYYDIVSKITRGEKINDLKLRVVYYARVSTDSDVQLNSFDNQLSYYENYIKSNDNWTFINGYTDEGISGTRATKRPGFMKMINDAKLRKFDLIITKDVSRFARDIEDSVHYTRKLKEYGVGVLFENQSLNTFDPNAELTLNILYNLSQEESKKISNSVKFGFNKAISNGRVLGSSNITGYKKDNCKLIVVKEEARFVKRVFELYSTGNYGFHKLSKLLSQEGYLNKKGKLYDKDSLKRIIENPKYKGYYRAKTYEILDYRTKKRKKNNVSEQLIYKCVDGSIPAIVSEELWDKANEVLQTRTKGYKDNNYWSGGVKYAFSSKIYCKEHNTNFQRSHGSIRKNRPTWSCGMYLQYRLSSCASPIISEADLLNIMSNVMSRIIPEKNTVVDSLLKIYESIEKTNTYENDLKDIDEQIKSIENKKSKAIELIYDGIISKDSLKVQFEEYENSIKTLERVKEKLLEQVNLLNQTESNINKIKNAIEVEIEGGSIDEFIRKFVSEIIVSKIDNDRYNVKLDIYLNLIGNEKSKSRGAKHILGKTDDDILFIENQACNTIEKKRAMDSRNRFTYSVYVESI